jgi:hypothetical protein
VFDLSAEVDDSVFQREVVPFGLFFSFAEVVDVWLPLVSVHFVYLLVLQIHVLFLDLPTGLDSQKFLRRLLSETRV